MYLDLGLQLTAEQRTFRKSVNRLAAKVPRPCSVELARCADAADVTGRGSPLCDVLRQAYRLGYHKVMVPEEFGGLGCSGLEQDLFLEELGCGSADFAIGIGVAGVPCATAARPGSPELVDELVRPFAEGTTVRFVGCWAMTEPDHGSDTLVAGTLEFHDPPIRGNHARRDGDDHGLSREYPVEKLFRDARASLIEDGSNAVPALVAARHLLAAPPTDGAPVRGAA